MIIRYGGGNDGIAEYLENGRKAEREYTRDELDHRYIIDGDLQSTNKIIQSMEDKGQERYLHITLSFAENMVSEDTLKAVTADFKKFFMNAYHDDEYSFYAEAHLPKLKNIIDNKTGKLVERKPHIHIVIPRTNLATGKSLNPVGDLTNTRTQNLLDSVQEHLNNKYNLVSPKDVARVSDDNYANVLSRAKGDLFRERNNEIKKDIFTRLMKENVSGLNQFKKILTDYGEVKIRNEGKQNQYFSVKFAGDKKFTNLKSPVFSQLYIEKRELPLTKPTPTQIQKNLATWVDKASHEIKHIYSRGDKFRDKYKSLTDKDKTQFLTDRINEYDKRYKARSSGTRGRSGSNKFRAQSTSAIGGIKTRVGVPRLPQRGLVYGINGRGTPPESVLILQDNEQRHLADFMEVRPHLDPTMRWDADRRFTERGIKTIEISSVLHESLYQKLNADAERNEIATMADIRRNIDPERFLSAVSQQFNVKSEDHVIFAAKDGSPRFSVNNRKLNASDFLTKYLNLSWKDSKQFLLQIYSQQLEKKPFEQAKIATRLNDEQSKQRLVSLKETNKFLHEVIRLEKRNLYNELREMRRQISSIPKEDRDVAKGVLIYKKLTTLERLNEISSQARGVISQYHNNWNEDKNSMKALDKLKNYLNQEDENGISSTEKDFSLEKAVETQRRLQALQKTNSRLKDLVMDKRDDKIIYRDQTTENPVFTDKGDFIVSGKNPSKEEIGVMLEYAQEKFGGVLKLTGSDEFRKQCAQVAAEKDMNLILRPEQYQKFMLEVKNELAASREQTTVVEEEQTVRQAEEEQTVSQAEVEQTVTDPQQSAVETKEIYLVSSTIAENENEGFVFHSKEEAFDYYNSQKSAEIERFESGQADFENTLIVAKTVPVHELEQYTNGQLGEFSKPYEVIADSFKDYDQSERGQAYKAYVLDTDQPTNYVYFVKFDNAQLDADPTGFHSLRVAADWRDTNSQLHDVNKLQANIYRVDEKIAEQKGLSEALSDAERVPRHELEKAQGRDISEQDGLILDAIDQYQIKFESEGLEFNRDEVEGILLHHELSRDIAEERLAEQFDIEKAERQQKDQESEL